MKPDYVCIILKEELKNNSLQMFPTPPIQIVNNHKKAVYCNCEGICFVVPQKENKKRKQDK